MNTKDDDGDEYVVAGFDPVGGGSEFELTAKKISGDKNDEFVKVKSNSDEVDKLRGVSLAVYVKATGPPVTRYQNEGWDPVELPL